MGCEKFCFRVVVRSLAQDIRNFSSGQVLYSFCKKKDHPGVVMMVLVFFYIRVVIFVHNFGAVVVRLV